MGRRKKPLPYIENLEIIDAGAEGKAVGKWNDRVVFVPFAAPGDLVDVKVYKKRRSYYEARIENLRKASEFRVKPVCDHFGLCGGCKWQHFDYRQQLAFKEKQVKDSLDRIGKVTYPEIQPIIGSDNEYYYRNKLEFTFSSRRWFTEMDPEKSAGGPENTQGLGFHLPGMFDKVLDITHCYLQPEPSNKIRNAVREFAIRHHIDFYDIRQEKGLLRNLMIRTSSTGDTMVLVVFYKKEKETIRMIMDFIKEKFPEVTSLLYMINPKKNDSIYDLEVMAWHGLPYIMEEMPPPDENQPVLRYKVGPKSFYQTNPKQAQKLYRTAFEFANFRGDELVYDLYTGTGTIANYIAHTVQKVIGVDSVEEAIVDARENAALNNITNQEFLAGDLARIFDGSFLAKYGKPDVIITDPPRAGMHEKVIQSILKAEPGKIVYVSCNPATQARDVALLDPKYEILKVQPVDMFPQTHHVENVILMKLRYDRHTPQMINAETDLNT
ncbi:MAG: 23S rRNA (uracil(1939)-C(5))-methyltransferase RlmD [bacterium]